MKKLLVAIAVALLCSTAQAETMRVTAYCACKKCCGATAKGITASGKKVEYGMVACNWMKFGTKVRIMGIGDFIVEDRGAPSLFGTFQKPIKHIDLFLPTHQKAVEFGSKYIDVRIVYPV